jgi:hypothetical protein
VSVADAFIVPLSLVPVIVLLSLVPLAVLLALVVLSYHVWYSSCGIT